MRGSGLGRQVPWPHRPHGLLSPLRRHSAPNPAPIPHFPLLPPPGADCLPHVLARRLSHLGPRRKVYRRCTSFIGGDRGYPAVRFPGRLPLRRAPGTAVRRAASGRTEPRDRLVSPLPRPGSPSKKRRFSGAPLRHPAQTAPAPWRHVPRVSGAARSPSVSRGGSGRGARSNLGLRVKGLARVGTRE